MSQPHPLSFSGGGQCNPRPRPSRVNSWDPHLVADWWNPHSWRLVMGGTPKIWLVYKCLLHGKSHSNGSGWWLGWTPLKKYEFVSWDDEIPNINGKIKTGNQTTNQSYFWWCFKSTILLYLPKKMMSDCWCVKSMILIFYYVLWFMIVIDCYWLLQMF